MTASPIVAPSGMFPVDALRHAEKLRHAHLFRSAAPTLGGVGDLGLSSISITTVRMSPRCIARRSPSRDRLPPPRPEGGPSPRASRRCRGRPRCIIAACSSEVLGREIGAAAEMIEPPAAGDKPAADRENKGLDLIQCLFSRPTDLGQSSRTTAGNVLRDDRFMTRITVAHAGAGKRSALGQIRKPPLVEKKGDDVVALDHRGRLHIGGADRAAGVEVDPRFLPTASSGSASAPGVRPRRTIRSPGSDGFGADGLGGDQRVGRLGADKQERASNQRITAPASSRRASGRRR